jgi:CheY-like chemotaxis protein
VSLKILIVDDNAENRFLLTKTLARCYPAALLIECSDPDAAIEIMGREKIDVVIAHRAGMALGAELIQILRQAQPEMPIVMVSGIDRSEEAARFGANRFLLYDQWLMIGKVVGELLDSMGAEKYAVETRAALNR